VIQYYRIAEVIFPPPPPPPYFRLPGCGLGGHFYPRNSYRPECSDVDAGEICPGQTIGCVKGIKAHAERGGFRPLGAGWVMKRTAQVASDRPAAVISFGQSGRAPPAAAMLIGSHLPSGTDLAQAR